MNNENWKWYSHLIEKCDNCGKEPRDSEGNVDENEIGNFINLGTREALCANCAKERGIE